MLHPAMRHVLGIGDDLAAGIQRGEREALAVFSQKFDNYKYIENISKKINLLILIPIFIIVLVTGLAIKAGSSEKFIYFDF